MNRRRQVLFVTLLLGSSVLPSGAHRLNSLDDVLCTCVEDVLGTGDFVSCVAHLTRRLVATGRLDPQARARAVSGAAALDRSDLAASCLDRGSGELAGWGVAVHVGSAFYPVDGVAEATVRLWNRTRDDILLGLVVVGPPETCLFALELVDPPGNVVRQGSLIPCLPAAGSIELPAGRTLEFPALVPLRHLGSATGEPDGTPLGLGVYRLRLAWVTDGPDRPGAPPTFTGGHPAAEIPLRVE